MSLVARRVRFNYTPYEPERTVFVSYAVPSHLADMNTPLPPNTIYGALRGYVSFIPYPTNVESASQDIMNASAVRPPTFEEFMANSGSMTAPAPQLPHHMDADFHVDPFSMSTPTGNDSMPQMPEKNITIAAPAPPAQATNLVRVFIGQLPYHVTEMQLVWICAAFGGRVMAPQRIMKANPRGERLPTGGVHVLCDEQNFLDMEQCMHKRVLIDDTGMWFAATLQEKAALDSFVAYLHANKRARRAGRPYDTVVVQQATSSFVPRRNARFDAQL